MVNPRRWSPAVIILALLIVGYVAFFSAQLFVHYYSFGSRAFDLGHFDQAIWHTIHGHPFAQTNRPGAINRLSIHVEPILLPVSLLYLIYEGPEILFIFQSIVIALGAVPVFALARYKLHSDGLALVFAIAYLMLPAMQGAALLDFHPGALAPTFLLAAFYFMEVRRPGWFALFAVLAGMCKEDMGLLVFMIGLYAVIINRQYRLGITTMVVSMIWTFLAVFVIPKTFALSENIHWDRYGHLGDGAANIVLNFVLHPQIVLAHLQEINVIRYFRLLLTPTAFLALLNPITLLLAAPSLGVNLLSSFEPMQEINSLVYAAPIIPALFISSIYGAANFHKIINWIVGRLGDGEIGRLRTTSHIPHPISPRTLNFILGLLILTATFFYHIQYGYFPGGGQYRGWPEITAHDRLAYDIFDEIPPDASLSAHDRLNPHVTDRAVVYLFDEVKDADYIVLDITEDSWPLHPIALRDRVKDFLAGDFGVVDGRDGYLLLAKNQPDLPKTIPDTFYDFTRVPDPTTFVPTHTAQATFDDKLQLIGYDLTLEAHQLALPVITLYWRALEPLEEDYHLWPFLIDRDGHIIDDTSQKPLVTTIWYPPSDWSTDEIIMTKTLPTDLAPAIGDEFTLAVGVTHGDWQDPAQRLPVTGADDNLYRYDNNTWVRLGTFQRTGRKTYDLITPPSSPQPEQRRQAEFWHLLTLHGLDLPTDPVRPGRDLPITFYWQSSAPITVDLHTFAQLIDDQGQVVAQLDWTPQDALGYLPTTAWQPERPVVDHQTLHLPADLPDGQYRLIVGWYYPVTGERLPLTISDTPGEGAGGDALQVGVITVR
ncbi:MAG: DUF2079 domain-containing protein [Anaerolineales bacterium]|nr:DUF2079 domain-containing protein [Anaerolineales bacterium]